MRVAWHFFLHLFTCCACLSAAEPELLSVAGAGVDIGGNGNSGAPSISADGRYVAFVSGAANLTTNANLKQAVTDVYLHDRETGATKWLSVSMNGNEGAEYHCWNPQISWDGSRVMFETPSWNLVRTATNGGSGVMVYDVAAGAMLHASVGINGANASTHCRNGLLSADGQTVLFESAATNLTTGMIYITQTGAAPHLFARNLAAGTTEIVDADFQNRQAARSSLPLFSSIVGVSSNGAIVAFLSNATNLVQGYPQNYRSNQLWIRHLDSNETELVNYINDLPSTLAITAASMSADGTKFAFSNGRTNFFRDMTQLNSTQMSVPTNAVAMTLSPDGELVAFFRGTPRKLFIGHVTDELFIELGREFQSRETNLVFSADGGTLLVQTDFGDSFEQEITAGGRPVRIKAVNSSTLPAVSEDGRVIARAWFTSTNRYENVFAAEDGSETLVSKALSGNAVASEPTQGPEDVSADGRFIVYTSLAALDGADGNRFQDVYLWDRVTKSNIWVSRGAAGASGSSASFMPKMTPSAEWVVFASTATNLIEGDSNRMTDVFVWRRDDGTVQLASPRGEGLTSGPVVLACSWPVISKDGRYAAFVSRRPDLVAGSIRKDGIYVRDLQNAITYAAYPTTNINTPWCRTVAVLPGPVAYYFERTNLYSFDLPSGTLTSYSNCLADPSFSANDKRMAVLSRVSGVSTIWVYETATGERQEIYRYPNAIAPSTEQTVSLSGDGKGVAFVTAEALAEEDRNGTNDVYVVEVDEPRRFRLAKPDALRAALPVKSGFPSLSADGRRVSFVSKPTDWPVRSFPAEPRVYLVDLPLRRSEMVSGASESNPYFGKGFNAPLMLRDGSGVVFGTSQPLVERDGNRMGDAYFADFSFASMTDVDGDEMADEWEMAEFGNLSQSAQGDEDQDGFSNLQEFLAGTDPTDGNSMLRLEVMEGTGDGIVLRWEASAGSSYEVQFKAKLEDAWNLLTEKTAAEGGIVEMEINGLQERGFYRIGLKQ